MLIKEKGLNISILDKDTKIIIQTTYSLYELKIVEGKLVEIFGGTKSDGTVRFSKGTLAILHGCTCGSPMLAVDWLGIGMKLEMHLEQDPMQFIETSIINKITVEAPDNSWSYSLNNEDQI